MRSLNYSNINFKKVFIGVVFYSYLAIFITFLSLLFVGIVKKDMQISKAENLYNRCLERNHNNARACETIKRR